MPPIVAASIAVMFGSAVQSSTGIGFGIVAAPYLIALMGPRDGVRTSILLSIIINLLLMARDLRRIEYARAAWIAVPAVIATFFIADPIADLDAGVLSVVAGVWIGVSALAMRRERSLPWLAGAPGGIVTGVVAAAMNLTSGVFGPPVAIYAVSSGWDRRAMVPTLQATFLVLNLAAIANLGTGSFSPWLVVALAAGWLLGGRVGGRMSERSLVRLVLIVSVIGSALAISRGLGWAE